MLFRIAGEGPAVVLIHGMVNASRHWERVAARLATTHTVIAPDLLGHGDSAKPEGDYSLGAHAAGIRDLLAALGVDHATIVGHSLGGGVAMQFFYQFPERTERMALISSGGLGPDVSRGLRLAAVPGAGPALALAASRPVLGALDGAARTLGALHGPLGAGLRATTRSLRPLAEPAARQAFLATLRAVIGGGGQRVSARDRLYLTEPMPTLVVWGERDRLIPAAHGRWAHAAMPWSRLELLPGVGHFPHLEAPDRLAAVLAGWLDETEPAALDAEAWRALLSGAVARPVM
jgi:pimeloyl-ACP methyl ester carboxylesterase